ncbi:M48 family metalloprotease [Pseudooceanicola onchidii]|uniref:M48 family metalloprotease n=1 Tax=Pseudooceanicola onchidii TaxID=2562279 RepID=UPI001F10AF0D|nr:M48 family metalloprotease [Pseudooceanicola onchidii]
MRSVLSLIFLLVVSACGTTYVLPKADDGVTNQATAMFEEARADTVRKLTSPSAASTRFQRVARRVAPVAAALCSQELAREKPVDCNVALEVDSKLQDRNAYFTYKKAGNKLPVIRFSMPLLQDVKSDDELAFILGHEYGHLIGQHIQKQQQQQIAGALILGAISAYTQASAASYGGYYDSDAVSRDVELGAQIGGAAFSKTYELESDMLGTRIAHRAGYDPVEGAKFFARKEAVKTKSGQLSFWGTHPADSERVAVVLATMKQIEGKQALSKKQN